MDFTLSLQIAFIGILVVFTTLLLLMVVIQLLQILATKKNTATTTVEQSQPIQEANIPPQHLAAIAAAISMLDQPYRIKSIAVQSNENWERSRYTDITTF